MDLPEDSETTPTPLTRTERDFIRFLACAQFLAISVLSMVLWSFRRGRDPAFQFTFGSVVAFLIGGALALLLWKFLYPILAGRREVRIGSKNFVPWTLVSLAIIGLSVGLTDVAGRFWGGIGAAVAVVSAMMLFLVFLIRTWDLK